MNYYRREYINGILRLCTRQSYRMIKATPTGLIRSDVLLALLNRSRIGIDATLSCLPSNLLTPDEAVLKYGITKSELRRWSRRKRKTIPHYRLNKVTVRYPDDLLDEWLKENSI